MISISSVGSDKADMDSSILSKTVACEGQDLSRVVVVVLVAVSERCVV